MSMKKDNVVRDDLEQEDEKLKNKEQISEAISGCCPEKNYCRIDCRPDDDKKNDIETGCSCGGNC